MPFSPDLGPHLSSNRSLDYGGVGSGPFGLPSVYRTSRSLWGPGNLGYIPPRGRVSCSGGGPPGDLPPSPRFPPVPVVPLSPTSLGGLNRSPRSFRSTSPSSGRRTCPPTLCVRPWTLPGVLLCRRSGLGPLFSRFFQSTLKVFQGEGRLCKKRVGRVE